MNVLHSAPAGYGFVTFEDRNIAQRVLHELNGKKIPGVEEVGHTVFIF